MFCFFRELILRIFAAINIDLCLPPSGLCFSCKLKTNRCLLEQPAGSGCALLVCCYSWLVDWPGLPNSRALWQMLCPTDLFSWNCYWLHTALPSGWYPASVQERAWKITYREAQEDVHSILHQDVWPRCDPRHRVDPLPSATIQREQIWEVSCSRKVIQGILWEVQQVEPVHDTKETGHTPFGC